MRRCLILYLHIRHNDSMATKYNATFMKILRESFLDKNRSVMMMQRMRAAGYAPNEISHIRNVLNAREGRTFKQAEAENIISSLIKSGVVALKYRVHDLKYVPSKRNTMRLQILKAENALSRETAVREREESHQRIRDQQYEERHAPKATEDQRASNHITSFADKGTSSSHVTSFSEKKSASEPMRAMLSRSVSIPRAQPPQGMSSSFHSLSRPTPSVIHMPTAPHAFQPVRNLHFGKAA